MDYTNRFVSNAFCVVCAMTVLALLLFYPMTGVAESLENGSKTYTQFCAGCHGADKAGLANFTGGLEELQAILDGETSQMPDFYGVFSEEEVADIFAFLQVTS